MTRKVWVALFWLLVLIYLTASLISSNHPLWLRILGLVVIIMWGLLTPISRKNRNHKSLQQ